MAIGALIPLIFGGGFALQERDRNRSEGERQALARGFSSAIGTRSLPGTTPSLFNDQNQEIGQLSGVGAVGGSGLLGNTTDPRLQEQLIQAGNIFGIKGGEQLGASMLQNVLASQQSNTQQANLFNQQEQSQQRGFQDAAGRQQLGFEDAAARQQSGFENSNEQNRLRMEQDAAQAAATLKDRRDARADALQLASDQFVKDNSVLGQPAGDKVRVPLPGGGINDWVDVPKIGTAEYTIAAGKVDTLAASVERFDHMMELFDEVGTNAFGKEGGELASRYTAAKLGMKNVFELGVLSADDERLLTEVMQDPNGFNAAFTQDETIKAGYQNAMEILQRSLRTENQKYQLWGIGSELDKTTPSQREELDEQARKDAAALEQNLTAGRAPGSQPASGNGRNLQLGRGFASRKNK